MICIPNRNVLDLLLHDAIQVTISVGCQLRFEKTGDNRVDADLER